jgi:hypothetical protein
LSRCFGSDQKIPFILGALIGGGLILAAVGTKLSITNARDIHDIGNDDPWEEEEFWEDYRRNI